MQESTSITFDPIPRSLTLTPWWEILLALVFFAGLIYFAVWRSRKQSNKPGSLKLDGK